MQQAFRFAHPSSVQELVHKSPAPTESDATLIDCVHFARKGIPRLEKVRAEHPVKYHALLSSSLPYTFREVQEQQQPGQPTPRTPLTASDSAALRDVMTGHNVTRAELWRAHYNGVYSRAANDYYERIAGESARAHDERVFAYMAGLDRPPVPRSQSPLSARSLTPPPAPKRQGAMRALPLPPLRPELPPGWAAPEDLEDAIDEFEMRQQCARTDAVRALEALQVATERGRGDNPRLRALHSAATRSVALNRFFVREHVEVVVQKAQKPKVEARVVERWNLSLSVWAERAHRCDAQDWYDTPTLKAKVIEGLWDRALRTDECEELLRR